MSLCTRLSRLLYDRRLQQKNCLFQAHFNRTFSYNSYRCKLSDGSSICLIPIQYRYLSMLSNRPFIGPKTLDDFHKKDGIPKSFTLIYRSNFQNYFLLAQGFVLLSIGAFLTCGVAAYLEYKLPTEERRKMKREFKERVLAEEEKGKGEKIELQIKYLGAAEEDGIDSLKNVPRLSDLIEEENQLQIFFTLISLLVLISASLFKVLRTLPVRIYVGKQKHCVGVLYGSILPGKLTHQDFVAGTLTKYKSKRLSGLGGESIFKDGSGNTLVLFEQFFRRSADFNYLLGHQSEDYEVQDGNDLSHFKKSGDFATDLYKKSKN